MALSASRPPATRAQLAALAALREAAGRRESGRLLVEGRTLLAEALEAGLVPDLVAVEPEAEGPAADVLARAAAAGARLVALDARAAARLSDREHAPGLLASVPQPAPWDGRLPARGAALVVALCGLQDPGNVGTLLRSARAFGAAPAVVRASAGAALRVPLLAVAERELPARAAGPGLSLAASAPPRPGERAPRWEPPARCLLLLGHETRGVPALPGAAPAVVPHEPGVESLNVAMAGSILLAEWHRAHRA